MAIITRQGSFPATGSDAAVSDKASSRQAALVDAIARIRVRARAIKIEQILLVLGGVAMPAGLLVIIVGWYGAAHTFRTYAQLDYLISGGLLGLALVIFGGFCYFGYWLTRMVQLLRTVQTQDQRSVDTLERISAQLAQRGVGRAADGTGTARSRGLGVRGCSGAAPGLQPGPGRHRLRHHGPSPHLPGGGRQPRPPLGQPR